MTKATIGERVVYRMITASGNQYLVEGCRVIFPKFPEFLFTVGRHPGVNDGRWAVTDVCSGCKVGLTGETQDQAVREAQKVLAKQSKKKLRASMEKAWYYLMGIECAR